MTGGFYFKTKEVMQDPELCGRTSWYRFAEAKYNKEAFSLLLAAHLSGDKIDFYISGCSGLYPSYPVVRWINITK